MRGDFFIGTIITTLTKLNHSVIFFILPTKNGMEYKHERSKQTTSSRCLNDSWN